MAACEPLSEYAWLVESIRENQRTMKNLEAAIDAAIEEMPDDFVIKRFLLQNKAEVKGMFLTEYDQEKVLSQERREVEYRVATDMLKEKLPLPLIAKISKLSEDARHSQQLRARRRSTARRTIHPQARLRRHTARGTSPVSPIRGSFML